MIPRASQSLRETPFYVSESDAPAKRKILIVALHLFVRDGLCETSIRDIAKESGFSNPALFKHFPSKEALAAYLFECCYRELFHQLSRAMQSEGSFAARHQAAIAAFLAAMDRDMDSVLFVQETLRYFWPKMPASVRRLSILGEVRRFLEAGRKEGAVTRSVDIGLLANAWIGTLQQFARVCYFGSLPQPLSMVAPALEELLTRMVGA
ncbi:MAG: TetR/AcrR family transcriptional regulator [Terracidiphilus sp.]|jgi:AcrR family transcriptional regulator